MVIRDDVNVNYTHYKYLNFLGSNRNVFVVPHFEILPNLELPQTKKSLVWMLTEKKAFPFHQQLCEKCHAIPGLDQWMKSGKLLKRQIKWQKSKCFFSLS